MAPYKHHLKIPGVLAVALLTMSTSAIANGRQPCDRGAGGIAYCVGSKFICNNGRVSGSKKTCDPSIHGTADNPRPTEKTKKK